MKMIYTDTTTSFGGRLTVGKVYEVSNSDGSMLDVHADDEGNRMCGLFTHRFSPATDGSYIVARIIDGDIRPEGWPDVMDTRQKAEEEALNRATSYDYPFVVLQVVARATPPVKTPASLEKVA